MSSELAFAAGLIVALDLAPPAAPWLGAQQCRDLGRAPAASPVGGMVTSTVLTLVVIPALYYLWRHRGLEGSDEEAVRA